MKKIQKEAKKKELEAERMAGCTFAPSLTPQSGRRTSQDGTPMGGTRSAANSSAGAPVSARVNSTVIRGDQISTIALVDTIKEAEIVRDQVRFPPPK